ncbi:hypothetical protein, partial [Haloquadratum walsbyi]|uniref:hypothetical protein n=1 Tax=Haloquadratum walsbyi TaxID=293091 RepID=UPI0026F29E71
GRRRTARSTPYGWDRTGRAPLYRRATDAVNVRLEESPTIDRTGRRPPGVCPAVTDAGCDRSRYHRPETTRPSLAVAATDCPSNTRAIER